MGHIKKNCFSFKNLQGNAKYVKAKSAQPARIQACIDILEDAAGMDKCEHCFQYNCNEWTCYFPQEKHDDMVEASVLFFNSDMHDTCIQSKQQSAAYEPQTDYEWYGDNSYHPEEAGGDGYWHDYSGGYDNDSWQEWDRDGYYIDRVGDPGYYTKDYLNEKEKLIAEDIKKKEKFSEDKTLSKSEEASSGEDTE